MTRVLIIDDEKCIRVTLREFLIKMGFRARTACDGASALQLMEHYEFDIIIADIFLPKMNGINLIKKIHFAHPECLLIVISGEPTVRKMIGDVRLRIFDYLEKPVFPDRFKATIYRAVQFRERQMLLSASQEQRSSCDDVKLYSLPKCA